MKKTHNSSAKTKSRNKAKQFSENEEKQIYESLTISKMSFKGLTRHFAPFILFVFTIAVASGTNEVSGMWKIAFVVLIILSLTLSVIPWLRHYLHR